MTEAVGIDFGTTYSCVGIWRNNTVEIIANGQGNRSSPSFLAFNEQEKLVGESAKSQAHLNPTNTVYDIKSLLGHKFSDPVIQTKMKQWPFKVVQGKDDVPLVEVTLKGKTKQFSGEDLAGMILEDMKKLAASYLGKEVSSAVVTVPSYFTDKQRKSVLAAAAKIKLNILRLINEPTAAAIAYGLDQNSSEQKQNQSICVVDFGGGACDVSLLSIQDGMMQVKAHACDIHLGGEDLDLRLLEHFKKTFERKSKVKLEGPGSELSLFKLRIACEKVKRSLSSGPQAVCSMDSLFKGKDLYDTISKARFEALSSDLFSRSLKPLKDVLSQAGMEVSELDQIVLVGGCTRIPRVKQMFKDFAGSNVSVVDSINPDEAVASGAAIQASLLLPHAKTSELTKAITVEVSSLTVGLAVSGGLVYPVIPRHSILPCTRTITTSTAEDGQTSVLLHIMQGERLRCEGNDTLGKFVLSGISKDSLRGVPQIEVSFSLDENSMLTVTAVDKASKKEEKMTVTKEEKENVESVEKMVKFAESNQAADRTYMETVGVAAELRLQLKSLRKGLQDKSIKDVKGTISTSCGSADKLLQKGDSMDLTEVKAALLQLQSAANHEDEDDDDDEDDDEGDETSDDEAAQESSDEDLD